LFVFLPRTFGLVLRRVHVHLLRRVQAELHRRHHRRVERRRLGATDVRRGPVAQHDALVVADGRVREGRRAPTGHHAPSVHRHCGGPGETARAHAQRQDRPAQCERQNRGNRSGARGSLRSSSRTQAASGASAPHASLCVRAQGSCTREDSVSVAAGSTTAWQTPAETHLLPMFVMPEVRTCLLLHEDVAPPCPCR